MTIPTDPAFPIDPTKSLNLPGCGLTKREYFAAIAMQGLLALPTPMTKVEGVLDMSGVEQWAKLSLLMADALIAELNKEAKP